MYGNVCPPIERILSLEKTNLLVTCYVLFSNYVIDLPALPSLHMKDDAVSSPSYWVFAVEEHVGFRGARHFSISPNNLQNINIKKTLRLICLLVLFLLSLKWNKPGWNIGLNITPKIATFSPTVNPPAHLSSNPPWMPVFLNFCLNNSSTMEFYMEFNYYSGKKLNQK